jgi:hypothetical protein
MSDENATVSLRSARESIRWLIKSGGVHLDSDGLKIPRDPTRSPAQLDVDEILERLDVLGVPEAEISIAVMRRKARSSYFEVRVTNAGVDVLAPLYPQLQAGLQALSESPPPAD